MEADPLYHVKQLFYQASYKACIAEATEQGIDPSAASDPLVVSRATYAARAHLALSDPSSALSLLQSFSATESSSIKAVIAFANYLSSKAGGGEKETYVEEVRDLVLEVEGEGEGEEVSEEEGLIRVIAGSVFILEGEKEEAVATLTEGAAKTSLECNALLVQLLLSLDRRDLAQATYLNAKKFGNDSMLVQAMEAWIGLKTGSRPLHQSYYFYEELYQLPSGRTAPVLASHGAAHYLLSHVEEAKADISEALAKDGGEKEADVLAVAATLGLPTYAEKLAQVAPEHPFAKDLKAKSDAFDEAAAKFAITA